MRNFILTFVATLFVMIVTPSTHKPVIQQENPLVKKQSILSPIEGKVYAQKQELVKVPVEVPKAPPVASGSDKAFIYMKESGNNPGAINRSSGACGLGQALPCSKMGCSLSDYACQDAWFTNYMRSRYGTWANAKAFWLAHHWW